MGGTVHGHGSGPKGRRLLLAACVGMAAATPACKGDPAADPAGPERAAPTTSAAPHAATAPPAALGPRALALADPGGSGAADHDIRALARRAAQGDMPADAWVLLGRAWVQKARGAADPGFYLNAGAAADVALDLEPGHRAALDLRAIVLHSERRFAEALDLADQILARDPDDAMALGTRSDALLELGRFAEAAAAAQRMVDLKPDLASYARASHIRWLQGDGEAAKRIARLAMDARDPRDPEPWAWVVVQAAMIFWHEGDLAGADRGFDRALEAVSEYPPALVGKGRVALAQGDARRAIELLTRALRQSPAVEAAALLGDARQAAGDAAGAAEAYALAERTGRQSDRRALAMMYATRGVQIDEALRLAEAERRERRDVYTEDTYAWALYRAGRVEEARAAADRALALGTRDARLLYHAGAIRLAAGERAAGERLLRQALRLNPRFDPAGAAHAEALLSGARRDATGG